MENAAIPLGILGQLLFTMMGPIGVIPVFAQVTEGANRRLQVSIALKASAAACVALILATMAGASVLAASGVGPPALIIAAGLVLTLASLQAILAPGQGRQASAQRAAPSSNVAFAPLAFPTMVRPYGIGVLIMFVVYFPAFSEKFAILGVALGIMLLNLGAMLSAHRIMALIGMVPLMILGSVFSILQVALGVEMLMSGFERAGLWH